MRHLHSQRKHKNQMIFRKIVATSKRFLKIHKLKQKLIALFHKIKLIKQQEWENSIRIRDIGDFKQKQ